MDIPEVPWHYLKWLRDNEVPIFTAFSGGHLTHLQIGAPGKSIPQEAFDVLRRIQAQIHPLVSEYYAPVLDGHCPDHIILKRRRDGIKGTWQAGLATHRKVWIKVSVKRQRRMRRRSD